MCVCIVVFHHNGKIEEEPQSTWAVCIACLPTQSCEVALPLHKQLHQGLLSRLVAYLCVCSVFAVNFEVDRHK